MYNLERQIPSRQMYFRLFVTSIITQGGGRQPMTAVEGALRLPGGAEGTPDIAHCLPELTPDIAHCWPQLTPDIAHCWPQLTPDIAHCWPQLPLLMMLKVDF